MTPPRPYSVPVGFACVVLGAGLFAWLVVNTQIGAPPLGRMVGTDPRLAFLLTPVFLLPILIYATLTGRFGLWWAFGLLVGITVFHGIALQAVSMHRTRRTTMAAMTTQAMKATVALAVFRTASASHSAPWSRGMGGTHKSGAFLPVMERGSAGSHTPVKSQSGPNRC